MTLASFWPVFHNDFIKFDDPDYVTSNPRVTTGLTWSNVGWAFQSGEQANWHPLTWLSHMLDVQLFGLQPGWHHLVSLLIHTANALLLFLVLRRMTGADWRSAFVALFFAVHPLHVESVAWVAERKDVLSTFFFMLTLWAYARHAEVRGLKCEVSSESSVVSNRPSEASASGNRAGTLSDYSIPNTGYCPRSTFHVSRFTLLRPLSLLLRPGLDEQADAGDSAVRPVAIGLLAAAAS